MTVPLWSALFYLHDYGIGNRNYILFTKLPWPGDSEGPFGLRVKLPPAHLSTTHGGGFTLSF